MVAMVSGCRLRYAQCAAVSAGCDRLGGIVRADTVCRCRSVSSSAVKVEHLMSWLLCFRCGGVVPECVACGGTGRIHTSQFQRVEQPIARAQEARVERGRAGHTLAWIAKPIAARLDREAKDCPGTLAVTALEHRLLLGWCCWQIGQELTAVAADADMAWRDIPLKITDSR